jgi:glycosyltransferase involved in cell wall biosynthesis
MSPAPLKPSFPDECCHPLSLDVNSIEDHSARDAHALPKTPALPSTRNPLISVVIPTYNYGRFVTFALESVLAQTYRNFEVIVVDDGSTDDTRQRLAPYMDRCRYLYQRNQGLSAARNTGIRAAQGELIALLDSDDVWHPRKLEFQAAYMSNHPEVGLLASAGLFNSDGVWPILPETVEVPAYPVTARQLALHSRFGPSGVLIRATCFHAVGLFDLDLRSAEDRDMWIRIAISFPIMELQTILWWGRIHPGSMSQVAARMEENDLKLLRKTFAKGFPLHGDWLLRLQSFSYAFKHSAYTYDSSGMHFRGLTRTVRSLFLWPFPFSREASNKPFERLRMLATMILRLARLKSPASPPPSAIQPRFELRASQPLPDSGERHGLKEGFEGHAGT